MLILNERSSHFLVTFVIHLNFLMPKPKHFILFFLSIGIIPINTFGQQTKPILYSQEIQTLLDAFRSVALKNPDSCATEFDAVYKKAIELKEYNSIAKAKLIHGIGYAYTNNIPKAIELFMACNDIATKLPPSDVLVDARNNIANMYITQGDTAQSLFYFNLGMEAANAYGNFDRKIITSIQLASLEIDCGKIDQAFENLKIIEASYDSIGDLDIKAYYHIAMSRIFMDKKDYESSLHHALKSLYQYTSLNDYIGMSTCNYYVGQNLLALNQTDKAISYCQASYTIADTAQLLLWQSQSCECLWEAYAQKGDYKNALKYHLLLTELNEKVKNDERIKDIAKVELQMEFKKEKLQDSLRMAEQAAILKGQQDLAIQDERSKSRLLYFGLAFLAIVALLLYRSFNSKKRDNLIILQQKNTVEQKQHEIMDSIAYAKRLQDAILPSQKQINNALTDNFVYYVPKDVVSGDFYWFNEIKIDDSASTIVLLAAADCTGHGVPGAMVSVVCSNALRRTVNEYNLSKPGEILDQVAKIVSETFHSDNNEVKDGMDIALCAIDKKNNKLYFAGANNPVWIARAKSETKLLGNFSNTEEDDNNQFVLAEIKGDRQPIGRFTHSKSFSTSEVTIQKNDIIYLFTDGIADQFGGVKGKKFKNKSLKKILLANAHLSMREQGEKLKAAVNDWQEGFEQTDDICLIGVRI